jgi:hypothetical protein
VNSIIRKITVPRLIARAPKAPIIIFFVSILLTAWLVLSCARIELQYLKHYGYFFDPASYYLHNIDLYRLYQQSGLQAALTYELTHNARFPARTVPYLLIAPQKLVTNLGHMWSEVPFIWLFLWMLASTILKRTHSPMFAIASISLFCGVPYLYDPTLGIAGYWLDFTSACALGSGALCLVNYCQSRNPWWMAAFGALASAAALSRFSSAIYVLSYASLAVPVALFAQIRNSSHCSWKSVLTGLAAALLTAAPGLFFLFGFLEHNRTYYSTYGYAFGAPVLQSILWTGPALVRLMGMPILLVLLAFSTTHIILLLAGRSENLRVSLAASWFPISVFAFVCFIVKAVDGWHCLVYFIPALLVSSFVPFGLLRPHHIWWRVTAIAFAVLAATTTIVSYSTFEHLSVNPPPHLALRKQADSAMARQILSTQAPSFMQFDTESMMPQLEVFLNHGFFSKWPSMMFSIHEAYMKNYYPGKTPTEAAGSAFAHLKEEVALVAIFADPKDALKNGAFDNSYSATVAHQVSQMVQSDSGWSQLRHIESPKGKLMLYWNARFEPATR